MSKYNWEEIQEAYNSGLTWKDLTAQFGVACNTLRRAVRDGRFRSRSHSEAEKLKEPRIQSPETKALISKARIAYLKANPDKVPYLMNHSSKRSWLELQWKKLLQKQV